MKEERNLNGKRVLDLSDNGKIALIVKRDCATRISVGEDGTLHIEHKRLGRIRQVA